MSNAKMNAYLDKAYDNFTHCETANGSFLYNDQTGETKPTPQEREDCQ